MDINAQVNALQKQVKNRNKALAIFVIICVVLLVLWGRAEQREDAAKSQQDVAVRSEKEHERRVKEDILKIRKEAVKELGAYRYAHVSSPCDKLDGERLRFCSTGASAKAAKLAEEDWKRIATGTQFRFITDKD